MREIIVDLGERSYPIRIEPGCLNKIISMLERQNPVTQVAVISDETVSSLYGDRVMSALESENIPASLYCVADGESSKSLNTANTLYTRLIEDRFHRDGLILALGGGVVGDLAGFIASTYLRGVRFAQVPTSLLAQIDSSVGGKVGINHQLGKNLIGSFYQPEFVLIDPVALKTLKTREVYAGLGEILKYGLIGGDPFISFLETSLDKIMLLEDVDLLSEMIETCCHMKADIVSKDEREGGWRRVLNLGHTVGHALELVTGFSHFRHGEAVVHGLHWAAWSSVRRGHLNDLDYHRISQLLDKVPTPPVPGEITAQDLLSAIQSDKKQTGQGIHIILLDAIGTPRIEKIDRFKQDDIQPWLQERCNQK